MNGSLAGIVAGSRPLAPMLGALGSFTDMAPHWDRPEEREAPHMVRSHKYGGQVMRQDQFLALEALPKELAIAAAMVPNRRSWAGLLLANRIRVRCSIRSVADVPPELAVETLALVREIRADVERRVKNGEHLTRQAVSTIVGGDEPWTPGIKRKLGRALEQRPDWRALHAEVEAKAAAERTTRADALERARKDRAEAKAAALAARHASPTSAPADEAIAILELMRAHIQTGALDAALLLGGVGAALRALRREVAP